jgi:monoterpene epsilon-lactone hydrolase
MRRHQEPTGVSMNSTSDDARNVQIHPLDPDDAIVMNQMRVQAISAKGLLRGIGARGPFDALMEHVLPRPDARFEAGAVGGVSGIWVHPTPARADRVILHLHGGWFNFGTAQAYRHLVGHIAARAGAKAFVPDYRLAPEHPFPAAVDDVLACYRALSKHNGTSQIAVSGDSAGGNLALVLASRLISDAVSKAHLVGVAAISPVTDLTLSGASYETRAEADPFFTKPQVAELVASYLGSADAKNPLASPLFGRLSGLAPVRIHVGDDEVLLDDSQRYLARALAAGVDAELDVWMGMPHGFVVQVGAVKAAGRALDATGRFLAQRLATGEA